MTKVNQIELMTGAIAGKVVSFPTDTVPALAVIPENAGLIFALKKRPENKPLILMAASTADLLPYIKGTVNELAIWQQVTDRYWPGQLTLVLPASSLVPSVMNPADPTSIGIRVPDSKVAQAILAQTGPLATTSANYSGQSPLESMTAIDTAFPNVLTLDYAQLDTEQTKRSGLPSTVAKWTGKDWEILRQGSVKL